MRLVVLQALRHFNTVPDNTTNGPDIKQITNLKERVENLIFRKNQSLNSNNSYFQQNMPRQHIDKRLNENDQKYFLEVVHNLLIEGVMMWGKDAADNMTGNYPWFTITSYGKRVLEAEEIIPHDPDNYLANLKKAIPRLDELVLMYIQESVQ